MLKKIAPKIGSTTGVREILESAIPWAFSSATTSSVGHNYKGQRGRIAIVGGSRDYTGAPYFAAISAMKLGCDLGYVICSSAASQIIKCHSPELIVMPLLDSHELDSELDCLLARLHALVIGPGLGRDEQLQNAAKKILIRAKKKNLPLVIDADGLLLVNQDLDLVKNYDQVILTPNRIELERLLNSVYPTNDYKIKLMSNDEIKQSVLRCAKDLRVTIMSKGPIDIIAEPNGFYMETPLDLGSDRRCGGQGDLLSGMTATFYHWLKSSTSNHDRGQFGVYSGYFASLVTRYCNQLAFERYQHSALAKDMIDEIYIARRWLVSQFEVTSHISIDQTNM